MLIDCEIVKQILNYYNISITGVLHIGAHECEELNIYKDGLSISPNDIIWIDANDEKIQKAKNNGISNVYHAVITDKDNDIVNFNIANNTNSSSIFDLKKHKYLHPDIYYVNTIQQKTTTIDSFFKKNNINPEKCSFWNFDIQGAELLALKGAKYAIKYAKVIYLEVNEDEIYKDCARIWELDKFLSETGFQRVHTSMFHNCGWGDAIYVRV